MSGVAPTARETRAILLASLLAAASSFAIMALATRVLPAEQNRQFLVFWAVLFGVFGVLSGIQHETTRAVAAHRSGAAGLPAPAAGTRRIGVPTGTPVLASAVPIGLGALVMIAASAPLWAPGRLPSGTVAAAAIIAVAALLYACHAAVAGTLAGEGSWRPYARLMAAEALLRLVATMLVAIAVMTGLLTDGAGLLALEAAAASAVLVWIVAVVATGPGRRAARMRIGIPAQALTGRRVAAMLTAACTAVLVTAYPTFIDAAAQGEDAAAVAALLFMLSLTRAPIMIPLQALQGVAITAFVSHAGHPLRALGPVMAKLSALAAGAAVVAALLGPPVLRLLNPLYVTDPLTWAGLTLAGGAVALLTLSGTAALAVDRHRAYAAGWLLASVVGVAALWLPLGIEARVILALVLGPGLGVALHLLLLRKPLR
ncbi:hypothetical protein [Brachybacterium hainanense]|uniref:Polysaccharide biosynthesis protein n=1 Tax=Brachybacterium hainanense TaxID=1541174 RepID=A0ABV6RF94_9MICO